ncbi:putative leucine-rich repeat domain superfamily [Helianthus anomalus]
MFREVDECSKISKQAYLRVLHMAGIGIMTFPESFCKLKHLKYLYLVNTSIDVLPGSIMYLQNLEYLNLSNSCIKVLPKSIMYLRNMQMLRLGNCYPLRKLPKRLKYMRNLHCLDINGVSLKHFPVGIKELTSLRTLPKFPVGKENGAKIGELGDLNLLEGEFRLEQLENVGSLGEAKSAKLQCKRNLLDLHLTWTYNLSLKKLAIFNYMGMSISPGWLVNLKKLVEIKFYNCNRFEHIPTLGRLPNLKVINLSYMNSFKCFVDDDTNMLGDTTNMFLSVEELHIKNCQRLVSLPSSLPKLKVLELYNCDALVSLPNEIQSFKDLKKLAISYCEQLRERYEMKIGTEW